MNHCTFLAVTGMSPAVLTESLWALAREPEPVIPDKVVVVTTLTGREQIERRLLAPSDALGGISPWEALRRDLSSLGLDLAGRLRFGPTGDNIRVLTATDPASGLSTELPDLRSPQEQEAAADFLLETVRGLVENPDQRLVASLAGGRKTMGALLYACLSLIGREEDRLGHVLVSAPYETAPGFWFPTQPGGPVALHGGGTADPASASIELADVPFISLRNLFLKELGQPAGSFRNLIALCSTNVRLSTGERLRVEIAFHLPGIGINGRRIDLSPREHLLCLFFALRAKSKEPVLGAYDEALVALDEFRKDARRAAPPRDWSDWRHSESLDRPFDLRDLIRTLSDIRAKARRAGGDAAFLASVLPERGRCSLDVPGPLIHIAGDPA